MNQRRFFPMVISIIVCAAFVLSVLPVVADAQGSSLTRGSRFTVTITGLPNTAYYVWLSGTWSMSGQPGDQPPVISDGANVQKDPPGGPYVIGSYPTDRGTIIDDVAPSTPDAPNTNYYALVTTDSSGQAVVEFRTSSNTGTRSFSVRVENPTSNSSNLQIRTSLFQRTTPPTPVTPTRITTIPTPATTVPTPSPTPFPSTPGPTPLPTTTPTPTVSLPVWVSIASLIACLVVLRRK